MDMRDALIVVRRLVMEDERVMVLVNDMGSWELEALRGERPAQVVNAGPAEQAMVGVAAGLALEGFRVVVYGIANFVTLRCCEQWRVDVVGMGLPVVVCGMGQGYSYSWGGLTHLMTEDLEVMGLLGFTVYQPSDGRTAVEVLERAMAAGGPVYVNLERGPVAELKGEIGEEERVVREGRDGKIVAGGFMVHTALRVAEMAEERLGLEVGVVDRFRYRVGETCVLRERARKRILSHGSRSWTHEQLGLDAESLYRGRIWETADGSSGTGSGRAI